MDLVQAQIRIAGGASLADLGLASQVQAGADHYLPCLAYLLSITTPMYILYVIRHCNESLVIPVPQLFFYMSHSGQLLNLHAALL